MIAKGERGSGGDKLEGVWDEQIPTTTHKAVSNPRGSPNPRGCPPIRTIFQSSPDALVNNRLLGNLKRERETSTLDAECSPRQLSLECSLSLGHLCWTGTQGPPGPSKPSVHTLRTFPPPGVGGWGAGRQSWDWALGTTAPFAPAGQGTPPQLQTGGWGGGTKSTGQCWVTRGLRLERPVICKLGLLTCNEGLGRGLVRTKWVTGPLSASTRGPAHLCWVCTSITREM